jgi:RHS repeat-associated protein
MSFLRLGSTTHLTDASGTVVERYRYNPFGSPFIRNAEGWGSRIESAYNNRFLYTGREWLAAVGLYDYRNRVYSANLGRFMQTDPIGFDAGDVNIYRYVGNEPVDRTDAYGLWYVHTGIIYGSGAAPDINSIMCYAGKPIPRLSTTKNTSAEMNCQCVKDCMMAHERSHIADAIKELGPDLCKNKPNGSAILYGKPFQPDKQQQINSEKTAHEVEIACLKKALEKAATMTSECKTASEARIKKLNDYSQTNYGFQIK